MVNGARLLNCPTALRLCGPTEFVQLFEVTGFVGRVRRQPPPGKTWAPYAKRACHEAQAGAICTTGLSWFSGALRIAP